MIDVTITIVVIIIVIIIIIVIVVIVAIPLSVWTSASPAGSPRPLGVCGSPSQPASRSFGRSVCSSARLLVCWSIGRSLPPSLSLSFPTRCGTCWGDP